MTAVSWFRAPRPCIASPPAVSLPRAGLGALTSVKQGQAGTRAQSAQAASIRLRGLPLRTRSVTSRATATAPSRRRRSRRARRSSRRRACARSCARAGQRRASRKLQRRRSPSPRRTRASARAKMVRNDEVEALPERLCGGKAEQRRGGAIPSADGSRSVGEDHGVRDLIENVRQQDSTVRPYGVSHGPRPRSNAARKRQKGGEGENPGASGDVHKSRARSGSNAIARRATTRRRRRDRRRSWPSRRRARGRYGQASRGSSSPAS